MNDFQAGDKVVCISASGSPRLREGRVYTVLRVGDWGTRPNGTIGTPVWLAEVSPEPRFYAFDAERFRKIKPDEREACEPEFVTLLKRIKTKTPA